MGRQLFNVPLAYLKPPEKSEHFEYPPPPLSFPTPGKTVPHHPLGDAPNDGPPAPPWGPHHHRTCTFAGTEIAA